jgi:glutamate-1-semialdehyde 2,1-aminomutase
VANHFIGSTEEGHWLSRRRSSEPPARAILADALDRPVFLNSGPDGRPWSPSSAIAMIDFTRSKALYERSTRHLAGGVSTIMRADARPVPLFIDHGLGPRVWDVDGNEYLDFTLAFGPLILGHAHPRVVAAASRALERGATFGAQHELEPRVAESLVSMVPGAEMVVFASTGTEAVQVALRLARAATGRERFIKFEGHYHGWIDNVLVSYRGQPEELGPRSDPIGRPQSLGQARTAVEQAVVLPWNDLAAVEESLRLRASDIAAIITEPVMLNSGGITPAPGYLAGLRTLCDRYGIVLIFDEVITGFRIALGGAQEFFGVRPDLAVFGKAISSGFPLSVVAGKRALMELIANRAVVHAGTLNGNPVSLAAADATLTELAANDGEAFRRLHALGDRLRHGLLAAATGAGLTAVADGVGPAFTVSLGLKGPPRDYREFALADTATYGRFAEGMARRGVLGLMRGMWYVSTAHTERDVDRAVERAMDVFQRVARTEPE